MYVCVGRSSLFPFEDGFLDDAHGDQSLTPGLNSPTRCQNGERMERYSRKVFVGGLPPDIDEGIKHTNHCCVILKLGTYWDTSTNGLLSI